MESTENISSSVIFSERLKSLRGNRSKADFSRFLGTRPQNYQRYEDGRIPDPDMLREISSRCGVTVDWLLGQDGSENISKDKPLKPHADESALVHLAPGWEDRLMHWIRLYSRATEALIHSRRKTFQEAIEPALLVFLDEERKRNESNEKVK